MQNDQLIPDLLLADDRRSNDSRTPSLNFQIDYFAPRIGRSEQSSPDSELLDVPNVSFNSISLTPGVPWYKRIFGVRRTDGNSWLSGGERPDVPLLSPVMVNLYSISFFFLFEKQKIMKYVYGIVFSWRKTSPAFNTFRRIV